MLNYANVWGGLSVDLLERNLIVEFLTLNHKIQIMRKRIAELDCEFIHAHSFMGSSMAVDESGGHCGPKPWYLIVEDLVRTQQETTHNIEIVEYERNQFKRFTDTLTADEQNQLEALLIRSNTTLPVDLEERTLAEIGQILEAVSWRFGLEQDVHLEPVHDASDGVSNVLSLFEVM